MRGAAEAERDARARAVHQHANARLDDGHFEFAHGRRDVLQDATERSAARAARSVDQETQIDPGATNCVDRRKTASDHKSTHRYCFTIFVCVMFMYFCSSFVCCLAALLVG